MSEELAAFLRQEIEDSGGFRTGHDPDQSFHDWIRRRYAIYQYCLWKHREDTDFLKTMMERRHHASVYRVVRASRVYEWEKEDGIYRRIAVRKDDGEGRVSSQLEDAPNTVLYDEQRHEWDVVDWLDAGDSWSAGCADDRKEYAGRPFYLPVDFLDHPPPSSRCS